MGPVHSRSRLLGAAASIISALLVVLVLAGPAGAAEGPLRWWVARVGPAGANGNVAVILSADPGVGQVRMALRGLPARAPVTAAVRAGTCTARGSVVVPLPPGRATAAGRFSRSRGLTDREARAIEAAGPMIVTVRAGAVARCAPLVERPLEAPGPSLTPSPTPSPSPTAAPTSSPSPTPGGTGSTEIGRKFMVGGSMYLSVQWTSPFTDAVGNTGVLLGVQLEALVPGLSASSDDFRMVQPDGSLRRPVYCAACDDIPAPWATKLSTTVPYRGTLLFLAPVLGPLDLRFTAPFGSVTIHVRD